MPIKRRLYKFNKKRRIVRKRRLRMGRNAISKGMRSSVHYFKRSFVNYINSTVTADWLSLSTDNLSVQGTVQVVMNNLPNVSEFAQLFAQYKILGVAQKIFFEPQMIVDGISSQDTFVLRMRPNQTGYVVTTGTTLNDWLQYQNVRTKTIPRKTHMSYYIKPKVATELYKSAALSGYGVKRPPYISTNQLGIPHYCFDMRFDKIDGSIIASNNQIPAMCIITTLYFCCKAVQ